jgi:hypothetical protein
MRKTGDPYLDSGEGDLWRVRLRGEVEVRVRALTESDARYKAKNAVEASGELGSRVVAVNVEEVEVSPEQ